jgi:hypothetical protein
LVIHISWKAEQLWNLLRHISCRNKVSNSVENVLPMCPKEVHNKYTLIFPFFTQIRVERVLLNTRFHCLNTSCMKWDSFHVYTPCMANVANRSRSRCLLRGQKLLCALFGATDPFLHYFMIEISPKIGVWQSDVLESYVSMNCSFYMKQTRIWILIFNLNKCAEWHKTGFLRYILYDLA